MQGSDPAWYEGVNGWTTLAQVPGIRVPQGTAPPPPYQPAPVQQPSKKKSPVLMGCGGCLGVIVLLIVMGTIFGSKATKVSQTSSDTSVSQSSSQTEQAPEEKAVEVSAQQLFQSYQDNELAADNQFKDKTILVTGTIQSIGKDIVDDAYVTLETSNRFMPVRCVFEKSEGNKIAQLSKGKTVTVRGICHGKEVTGGVTVAYATLP